jgi:hypothetical protein
LSRLQMAKDYKSTKVEKRYSIKLSQIISIHYRINNRVVDTKDNRNYLNSQPAI